MRNLFYFLILLTLASCGGVDAPDVSRITVDTKVTRFEQDFFRIDTGNIDEGVIQLQEKYPQFVTPFFGRLLGILPTSPDLKMMISAFRPINDTLQKKYPDLDFLEEGLEDPFRYVKHYYPDYKLPRVISYISTFDAPGAALVPGYLAIGLHQFAGRNFSIYDDPQIQSIYPEYIQRRFEPEYMAPACMKVIAGDIYQDSTEGKPLLVQMIEKGKEWFLVKRFMPETHDSLITGYTGEQLNWAQKNEGEIWAYMNANADFYAVDPIVIQDYIGDAPFTKGMPQEYSPGNIGQWIGWKIVEEYATASGKSVQDVMRTPAMEVFNGSKYKPK